MFTKRWGTIDHVSGKMSMAITLFLLVLFLIGINQPVQAIQGEPDTGPAVKPGVHFTVEDTGVCIVASTWIEATVTVTLPKDATARLQASYHIVMPERTNIKYIDAGIVRDGDTYTFKAYWPGIQPGDKMVEIHWGAALLDVKTGRPMATTGLDYFWYPYICKPYSQPDPTHAPTIVPIAEPTAVPTDVPQPTRAPEEKTPVSPIITATPLEPSQLPTLAPPLNPSEDRYAVLPETGAALQGSGVRDLFISLGLVVAGAALLFSLVSRSMRKKE
jgi:hypothetical protein